MIRRRRTVALVLAAVLIVFGGCAKRPSVSVASAPAPAAPGRRRRPNNLALGERRARAASNFLVAQGVAARRVAIVSYGEERPLCVDETEACWARNRRAMFLTKPE